MEQLRDRFWLWGHPEGRYNHQYGNDKVSRMTPMEGVLYLGARNVFMVPVGVAVNRRQYNKSFSTLRQVGWEIYNAGLDPSVVEPLIEEAGEFCNIRAGVFDDFVRGGTYTRLPLDNLYAVSRRLHDNGVRRLDMWMVLYTHEFGADPAADARFQPYIDPFDGVILWTWKESDLPELDAKFEVFKALTAGKRRMLGCYLYNFGEQKQATGRAVCRQLDRYRAWMAAGEAEGVVLHTNTMADLDYEAYDAAIDWMRRHGDEPL